MAAHSVDFIDEDNAGGVLLALLEQIADAAGAHADEHLDEIRTRNREKRNVGLAGNGARQQRFSGPRRADEQNAFRNAPAEFLKLLRLAEELDDFLQFFLGLFHARDILERDFLLLRRVKPRTALSEAQRFIASALHLAHHKDPECQQQNERDSVHQDRDPIAPVVFLDLAIDAFLKQVRREVVVVGWNGGMELFATLIFPVDFAGNRVDGDALYLAIVDLLKQLRELRLRTRRFAALEHRPDKDDQAQND